MMQEDIEQKSVVFITKGTKITARLLAKAMGAGLRQIKKKRDAPGKQSMKQLSKGGSLESIPISDNNIKAFDPIARKYGVRYKLFKDDTEQPPKWLVFFRAKDTNAMTSAFKEFTHKMLKRETEKPSVRETMAKFRAAIKQAVIDRTKHQERGGPEL
ncbi:MAG: PcfB family protein [Christensenella sp.]|uniref:PcfB family protein n=1 Tax=Christensenella sp. TaxID=1935934 RepID=UPI002B21FD50|nr:PcfB family protein [Christensenella sp.]MEA5003785.1 PcfB family protein [Christensenella sp.]